MGKLIVLVEAKPFCIVDNTPLERLEKAGLEVINMIHSGFSDPEFRKALKIANIVICGNELLADNKFFQAAPNLKMVAKIGVGIERIDTKCASKHGVMVCNTPGANSQAVADHTFALILGATRRIPYSNRSIHEKKWEHTKILSEEIWHKTLGIVGLGAIGRNVAMRASGFQMKIIACDPVWPDDFANEHAITQVSMKALFTQADIITLHIPLTPETKEIINEKSLQVMKPSAFIINTARGGLINEYDLADALENGKIAGAGIDVFAVEPPHNSPLIKFDNVVATPHIASFTYGALNNMNQGAVNNVIDFVQSNCPESVVNKDVVESFFSSSNKATV